MENYNGMETSSQSANPPGQVKQKIAKKLWLAVVLIAILAVLGFWLTKKQNLKPENTNTAKVEDKNDKEVEASEPVFK